MLHPERFSLEWSEFETNVHNTFADLRREEHFSDVTLVSEDGHLLKSHKVLLAASSPLLDTILKKSQDHPKPMIFLRGAKTDVLNSVLDFIYYGKVDIAGDMLEQFLALADELKVKGLSKKGEDKESGEHDSIGNKKMKKTNKLVIKEEIDMTKKSKCDEIEEDKSDGGIKDDYIDMSGMTLNADWENTIQSGNADWQNTTMNLLDCNLCEKTSTTLQGLERHKYRYHPARREKMPEANETEEDETEKDTKDKIVYPSENLVWEDDKTNSLFCNLCEKTSLTIEGLGRHKYRYHKIQAEGPGFSCGLCDSTSRSKAGLYKHKIRRH